MRFREIREIKEVNERVSNNNNNEKHYAFMDIKPQTDIIFEECKAFWDNLFQNGVFTDFEKEED